MRRGLVAEVRAVTGLSREALARKLGIAPGQLDEWASGRQTPKSAVDAMHRLLEKASSAPARTRSRVEAARLDDAIVCADGIEYLKTLPSDSVDMILSDIPYGIGLDDWDVLHANTNSAYMGESAGQKRAGAVFKRRRKPINGWSSADRRIPKEYYEWCSTWAPEWLRVLKPGGTAMVFAGRRLVHRCIAALEDAGFNHRDLLAWHRPTAVLRAQRLSGIFQKRGELAEAARWRGWRVGNLRPTFEPIVWAFKPYKVTIADNMLDHEVGAFNLEAFEAATGGRSNVVDAGFESGEAGHHEAQKPVRLLEALIELCTVRGAVVLDPFAGSGSTAVAARKCRRRCVAIERDPAHVRVAKKRLSNLDT